MHTHAHSHAYTQHTRTYMQTHDHTRMARWRFKVTEWRLSKLQWSKAVCEPAPQGSLAEASISDGQEGFRRHGIYTNYAVSTHVHHPPPGCPEPPPSSSPTPNLRVLVRGRPPGRLVHLLPPFLQHLARCSVGVRGGLLPLSCRAQLGRMLLGAPSSKLFQVLNSLDHALAREP